MEMLDFKPSSMPLKGLKHIMATYGHCLVQGESMAEWLSSGKAVPRSQPDGLCTCRYDPGIFWMCLELCGNLFEPTHKTFFSGGRQASNSAEQNYSGYGKFGEGPSSRLPLIGISKEYLLYCIKNIKNI